MPAKKKTEEKNEEAKVEETAKATYSEGPSKEIQVETTGDFQLYDVRSQTLYPVDKAVKANRYDPFVDSNIKKQKLREVK